MMTVATQDSSVFRRSLSSLVELYMLGTQRMKGAEARIVLAIAATASCSPWTRSAQNNKTSSTATLPLGPEVVQVLPADSRCFTRVDYESRRRCSDEGAVARGSLGNRPGTCAASCLDGHLHWQIEIEETGFDGEARCAAATP